MKINLSPAQIGRIVFALDACFPQDSEEIQTIAEPLCDAVFKKLGPEFYDMWVEEFNLNVSEV